MLMCAECRAVRHDQPAELLADHDPGQPWLKWDGLQRSVAGQPEETLGSEEPGRRGEYRLLVEVPATGAGRAGERG